MPPPDDAGARDQPGDRRSRPGSTPRPTTGADGAHRPERAPRRGAERADPVGDRRRDEVPPGAVVSADWLPDDVLAQVRRTMRLSVVEGSLTQVFLNWTSGAVLIGYMLHVGAGPPRSRWSARCRCWRRWRRRSRPSSRRCWGGASGSRCWWRSSRARAGCSPPRCRPAGRRWSCGRRSWSAWCWWRASSWRATARSGRPGWATSCPSASAGATSVSAPGSPAWSACSPTSPRAVARPRRRRRCRSRWCSWSPSRRRCRRLDLLAPVRPAHRARAPALREVVTVPLATPGSGASSPSPSTGRSWCSWPRRSCSRTSSTSCA
jgi:hypothetical protein